jgi:lysophospholipase L1-like esterase
MMKKLLFALLLILVLYPASTPAQSPSGKAAQLPPQSPAIGKDKAVQLADSHILWYDARELVIEGRGWRDTEEFYDRLPARAKGVVRDPVWDLSRNSTGICVRFSTDATAVKVRWSLRDEQLALEHMPATGVSGVDLYIRTEGGGWGWLAVGRPSQYPANQKDLVGGLPPGWHEFLLYLPLYNGVSSVQVGIASTYSIAKAPPRPAERIKPICFYGTSIVQGGCASRPGMVHTAILGRRLDWPVINLGFSGNGPMELELARLMTELDPAAYVIDCLPNMEAGQVTERALPFVKMLREARPDTPIILVENIPYQGAPYLPGRYGAYTSKNAALRQAFQQMIETGIKGVLYLPCGNLLGHDEEATVDGTHPTDLGFMRMADALEPVLRQALRVQLEANGKRAK